MGLIDNNVSAYLGSGKEGYSVNSILLSEGDLIALAKQGGKTKTFAGGYSVGKSTAIGAAVALNLAMSDVLAQVVANGSVSGKVEVKSETVNYDDANALALAMGADMERYTQKLAAAQNLATTDRNKTNQTNNNLNNRLNQQGQQNTSNANNPLSSNALQSQNAGTVGLNQQKNNSSLGSDSAVGDSSILSNNSGVVGGAVGNSISPKAQENQSLQVAAAVGVSVTNHATPA